MSEPTLDTLTQRLDRLERQARWWRVAGSSTACALVLLMLLGAAQSPKEIQAKRFTLIDRSGAPAAWLGLDNTGKPFLSLRDDSGSGQRLAA